MTEPNDWLHQTWDIKRILSERYAGVTPSAQLRDMRARVEAEWARRGWTLREPADASRDTRTKPSAAPDR
jgi:hypothetical protein